MNETPQINPETKKRPWGVILGLGLTVALSIGGGVFRFNEYKKGQVEAHNADSLEQVSTKQSEVFDEIQQKLESGEYKIQIGDTAYQYSELINILSNIPSLGSEQFSSFIYHYAKVFAEGHPDEQRGGSMLTYRDDQMSEQGRHKIEPGAIQTQAGFINTTDIATADVRQVNEYLQSNLGFTERADILLVDSTGNVIARGTLSPAQQIGNTYAGAERMNIQSKITLDLENPENGTINSMPVAL